MLSLDVTHGEVEKSRENHQKMALSRKRWLLRRDVYPPGKPRILHLLRCQGLAIVNYGFALGRLGATALSAFATMR